MRSLILIVPLAACVMAPPPDPPPAPTPLPSPVWPDACVEDWYAKTRLPSCVEDWITDLTVQQKKIETTHKVKLK